MRRIGERLALSVAIAATPLVMVAAQLPTPDKLAATGGDITIAPINHATLQLTHAGKVIDVDPVAAAGSYAGFAAPDVILITDIHGDHLDPATVNKLKKATTTVVAPQAAVAQLTAAQITAVVMANGDKKAIEGIEIEAVPMYNLVRKNPQGDFFHTKGRGNGYVLTIGGKRLYIAGDTEGVPEMRALKNIDVAFVPMNLPYTMTEAEAADAVKAFKPKVVYPYHYRGSDLKKFEDPLKGSGVEVRVRDWYAK
ncbi:MAG TPA: MBL fold metallo-hydrolase [Vicinamibacterales bacterium]|nr:MBL fold metallo-hydrolase [Vicinamibacterales bacterium]